MSRAVHNILKFLYIYYLYHPDGKLLIASCYHLLLINSFGDRLLLCLSSSVHLPSTHSVFNLLFCIFSCKINRTFRRYLKSASGAHFLRLFVVHNTTDDWEGGERGRWIFKTEARNASSSCKYLFSPHILSILSNYTLFPLEKRVTLSHRLIRETEDIPPVRSSSQKKKDASHFLLQKKNYRFVAPLFLLFH